MKLYIDDIEDVVKCVCGLIVSTDICTEGEDYSSVEKGKCPVCKRELTFYKDD